MARLLAAELLMTYVNFRRYPLETGVAWLLQCAFLAAVGLGTGYYNRVAGNPLPLENPLLGYLLWTYAAMCIDLAAFNVAREAQTGTLEQYLLNGHPPALLVTTKLVASLFSTTVLVGSVLAVMGKVFGARLSLGGVALLVIVLTLVGVIGLGLMLAGVIVVYKRASTLGTVLQISLLFLTGAIVPLEMISPVLASTASVLPLTLGIRLLREVTLSGQVSSALVAALAANSAAYLAGGVLVFNRMDAVARRRGLLGHY